jgi:glycine/D-amino acid oxidase-like deaminating enzyme
MQQPLERIQPDMVFVQSADVVVIGAGIAGIAAAYFLAKKGLSVVVLEKGLVGAEQSSRNWGWVRQVGRDEAELDLMARSLALWHRLPQEAGKDFGFEACGVLFVTDSRTELEDWSRWRTMAGTHGVVCDQLTRAEVEQRIPAGTKRWVGGLYSAEDGRAEPATVVPELAKACQALGVRIYEQCAARVLDLVDGRVRGVASERGLIKSNAVLCAGGVWTALFARKHGVDVPQGFVHGSVLCTEPGAPVFDVSVATPTFCARRRSDDGYTVAMSGRGTVHITPSLLRHAWKFLPLYRVRRKGLKVRLGKAFFDELFAPDWNADTASPFEKTRTLDPAPDPELLARALAEFRSGMPGMQAARGASSWGASIDSLPDAIPVISAVPALPGFFLSTGYSGHGFGIGLGAGELAADLVAGDTPRVDPHPFRYMRLVDGTRLRPQ